MHSFSEFLRARQSFLLTGHENPDGDCVGAETALYHLLRALGKQVAIVNPDPLARSFDFLLAHTPFGHAHADEPLPAAEAVVLLDCAQLSRLGPLGARLRDSGCTIAVVDHHVDSERGDGEIAYVDATAASTGTLVRRLFRELGLPLTVPAAEGIFLSLVADTGWFRYSNTDAEVFTMAAELLAVGVDGSRIYDLLYRRNHADSAHLLGEALRRHELRLAGRLALVSFDRLLLERARRADFDTDAVLDPLRSIDGVEVVALLKERPDRSVKCSLRARGDVDVQAIVASFGGGGHRKAAGATLMASLSEAEVLIEAAVARALAGAADGRAVAGS